MKILDLCESETKQKSWKNQLLALIWVLNDLYKNKLY